jgi:hypothetical protein
MTASELITLGRQIEELEKPKAAERKAATQLAGRAPGGSPIGAVPTNGTEKYDSRERAAEAVGLSTAWNVFLSPGK